MFYCDNKSYAAGTTADGFSYQIYLFTKFYYKFDKLNNEMLLLKLPCNFVDYEHSFVV